ncbi:hemin uptake protein HemP [Polaromonas sp. A23]|uniref:hemin uptake protein HemP n=1 Tax=Polaromonas sp. A23 TaxID=1944133 RepID=UPI0009C7C042|nr:hemin uptake protein HemP [Polaromonas sp. A23]OOG47455.1 hemin transporter HemP [Polaromonas sp. A23]
MSFTLTAPSTLRLPSRQVQQETVSPNVSNRGDSGCAVDSTELLRGQKAVDIVHNGSTYRLQATRLGKLILTK